jgi:hypothetical protein
MFYARRYDQAIRRSQSSLELQTDSPAPHYTLFLVYQHKACMTKLTKSL